MDQLGALTPRERQCLMGVARHLQSKEIARELGLEARTVDKHIERAIKKLGAVNRRDAARMLVGDLRNDHVGAPLPLAANVSEMLSSLSKGGAHAAYDDRTTTIDLGRPGGDFRQSGGDRAAEGNGASPSAGDAGDEPISHQARSAARGYLHRARLVARRRTAASTVAVAGPGALGPPWRRLLSAMLFTLVAGALLIGGLAIAVQLGHLMQTLDTWLTHA